MLRLKREEIGLIFELKPPFNDKFFSDLRSTIADFMKIGKKTFCYDFGDLDEMDEEVAEKFEDIISVFKSGNCALQLINISDAILAKLPQHKSFAKESVKDPASSVHFSIESQIDSEKGLAILKLGGEFMEPYSLEEFKVKSFELMEKASAIILDCKNLTHISTLAVGGFVFLKSHCDSVGKRVALCHVSQSIHSTLEMSGILHIIPVQKDLNSAIDYLKV